MLPHLPLELVLHVISSSLPASPDALLNAAHLTTKLLLTFTLVCRETRRTAHRYLRQHCAYLDSEQRLELFLSSVSAQPTFRTISALLLAPFDDSIDNLPLCLSIQTILSYTCGTLKKLIIDMPLRSCYPEEDDHNVRRVLKEVFEKLVNLEEFVSTQDELYLDTFEGEHAYVWNHWPRLKRLALWNVDADEGFWRHVALHPSLEMVVLSSTDGLMETDPKAGYFKHASRPIHIVFCAYPSGRRKLPRYLDAADWEKQDPERQMQLSKHIFSEIDKEEDLRPFQEYIQHGAEDGTLWQEKYSEIMEPIDMVDL
jgi:hypothetical protein